MFIISLTYKVPLQKVDEYLKEHVDYLKEQYQRGNFILSGRKNPRSGGVIISNVQSIDQINEIIKHDPFNREGLADYEVIDMTPTMSSAELAFLKS